MRTKPSAITSAGENGALDFYAASVAILCLLHCLALPLLVASVSLAIPFLENELVHKFLVLIAAPATALILVSDRARRKRRMFTAAAITGLALLIAAAFVPAREAVEQGITVAGSVLLASAHIWRARSIRLAAAAQRVTASEAG